MRAYKLIATFFGIGYIGKGAGTITALLICVLLYYGVQFNVHSSFRLFLFSLGIMFIGIAVASKVEKSWGKDSKYVVIDEALGMSVSLLFLPINFTTLSSGFLLFRFFDIYKPFWIKRTEDLPGGWGVMMDDLLAGIYTNILLQTGIYFFQ